MLARRLTQLLLAAAVASAATASATDRKPGPSGSAGATAPPALYRDSRVLMGTLCEIEVYDGDGPRAAGAMTQALDEMARVDRLLSNYNPASELSAMNREASHAPFHASDELFAFVRTSRRYYELSHRAFDPTVGPLVRAWGFFTRHPARPADGDISKARAESGFDKVVLDDRAHTVFYQVAGLEIDPGGIGKGYAVDRAADVLDRAGIGSALVSAGGSTLYAIGHPPDRPGWRVAVKDPLDPSKPYAYVALRDSSLSTSGLSEKFVQEGAHRYGHIFDPRRGEPIEGICQATVIAPAGTESDALSKPAFILPRDELRDVAKALADVHVLRVEGECGAGATVWTTPWSEAVFQREP